MGTGESGLPFYNLDLQYKNSAYAWSDQLLGNTNGIGTASSPTYWLLSRFEKVGMPGFAIQALFTWIIFVVSGLSVYLLTKELFKISDRYILLAVFFYWFNPFSLVNVWNRFLYNYMSFLACLPLVSLLYLKGLKEKKYIYAFMVSLVSFVFSYALTLTPFTILLFIVFLFMTVFYILVDHKGHNRPFYLKFFVLTTFTYLIANLWWIIQVINVVSSSDFGDVVSQYFRTKDNLATFTSLSAILGKLTDVFRYTHGTFFGEFNSPWTRLFRFPVVILAEFMLAFLMFYTAFKNRKNTSVLLLSLFLLLGILLTKGSSPPFGEIINFVFTNFSVFQVFRNPFEKFGFLLPLASSSLFAYSVFYVSNKMKRKFVGLGVYLLFFGFVFFVWGNPFLTGDVFTGTDERDNSKTRSYNVNVPNYYEEANEFIQREASGGRFISLPMSGVGMTYTWERPYAGVELSSNLFDTPNVSSTITIPYYDAIASSIEKLLLTKDNFSIIPPLLTASNILVRNDVDWQVRSIRDPELISSSLVEKGYVKAKSFGNLTLYSHPDDKPTPLVWASVNAIKVEPVANINDFFVTEMKTGDILYSTPGDLEYQGTFKRIIKPIATTFLEDEKKYRVEDALATLLHARHLPDSPIKYKLIRLKEYFERMQTHDSQGLYIFDLTHLGKRAVEIYSLAKTGASTDYIRGGIDTYFQKLESLQLTYPERFLVEFPDQISRLTHDEFLKHLTLFADAANYVNDESKDLLESLSRRLSAEMVKLGLAADYPLRIKLNKENSGFWIHSFKDLAKGSYQLVTDLTMPDASQTLLDTIQLQIDNEIVTIEPKFDKKSGFSVLNSFDFDSGFHEVTIPSPLNQLVVDQNKEINLISGDQSNSQAVFPLLPFDPFVSYKISFDYWIKRGRVVSVLAEYDNDVLVDGKRKYSFEQRFGNDGYDNYYKSNSFYLTPRGGSSEMRIVFRVDPFNDCRDTGVPFSPTCKDDSYKKSFNKPTEVVIKNIRIARVSSPQLYLISSSPRSVLSLPQISFDKLDPATYDVRVTGATNPFVLILSQLYNSGWEAKFSDGTKIETEKHFSVNGYANGWIVDKTGDFQLRLRFLSQDLLDKGKLISFAFLGFELLVVIILKIREVQLGHHEKN